MLSSTVDAQITGKVCYCNIFPLTDVTFSTSPQGYFSERYTSNGRNYAISKSAFPVVEIMSVETCNQRIINITNSDLISRKFPLSTNNFGGSTDGYVVLLPGQIMLDQTEFSNQVENLKNSLVSYIDKRHKEVKDTLLANINRINKEAMNDLLVQDTFLLKNGLAEVITEEPVNKKLVEALQYYKVPPDLLKNGIVAVIRDSTEVRDELIEALRTYIPEDSLNREGTPGR
jgi:hypothetical protein